jgi:hypothetical protein
MPVKPTEAEEEYFKRQDLERKKRWEAERMAKMAVDEKQRLKDLHWMKCPKCGMDLSEFDFHGVKLDRCLHCNGTFFDHGEIEALLERHEPDLLSRVLSIFK